MSVQHNPYLLVRIFKLSFNSLLAPKVFVLIVEERWKQEDNAKAVSDILFFQTSCSNFPLREEAEQD